MSSVKTQIPAVLACYYMRRCGYYPGSVINVGVGTSSPEYSIWKWLLPKSELVGIDPRHRHSKWGARYIQAAAGDGSKREAVYCGHCRSIVCDQIEEHGRPGTAPVVTIDEVARDMPGPYFLWLDCEGGELDALRGAEETLKQTWWISLEVRAFSWAEDYPKQLEAFLRSKGFHLWHQQAGNEDRLYRRRRGRIKHTQHWE